MSKTVSGVESELKAGVSSQIWFELFNAATLLECILELLKNGFDWNAQTIDIRTDESKDQYRFVDNGLGMDARNRAAFVSIGHSTAGGDQSGTFGTGAKKIIFTFANHVRVVTAPEDDPSFVWVFEFTPGELAEAYSNQGSIQAERRPKNARSWPHNHPFGSDILFNMKDSKSRSLVRGPQLAQKLSDRLDLVVVENSMVRVDNQALPPKKLIGRVFRYEMPAAVNPRMGRIKLEFYRPEKRTSDEDLRMTGRSIGEVSFRDTFVKLLLSDELRDQVPVLFLENEVHGLITAGFLNDHVTESRDRYDPGITDDERIVELLRMLRRVEPDVAEHLGIKLRQFEGEEVQGKEVVALAIDRLRRLWVPEPSVNLPGLPRSEQTEEPGYRPPRPPRPRTPAVELTKLVIERGEYELGELIEAELVVSGTSHGQFHFYTDNANAEVLETRLDGLTLRAKRVGHGTVQAVNPQTGEAAKAEYEVVKKRVLHLSSSMLSTDVDTPVTLSVVNTDKVVGKLNWSLSGAIGELQPRRDGTAVTYVPQRTCRIKIVAIDSGNPAERLSCDLHVLPNRDTSKIFRIRDEYFVEELYTFNTYDYRKMATIINAGPGEVHRMIINTHAPDYRAALRAGVLVEALLQAMSFEFAKEFCVDYEELNRSDLRGVMVDVQIQAAALFEEMLGS